MAATPPIDFPKSPLLATFTRAPTKGASCARTPVAAVDVYVDNFLLLAQATRQQQRVLQAALQSIEAHDPAHCKEPASTEKPLQNDAYWMSNKRILGWDIDTMAMTLNLRPHCLARLRDVLGWLMPPRKRLAVTKWHRLLGELRSMVPALPGTRGLFSVLQEALSKGDGRRVRLTQHAYDTAADFTALVDSLATRPTRLPELVPTAPSRIGACDASQVGMGGVWLATNPASAPVVWRQRFSPRVASALVTANNRRGTLSILDLELTGIIAHMDVAATTFDVRERTLWIASDNQAAVSWSTKGSASSMAARAYLLRLNAIHQRHYRYLARHHYIPGPVNAMAHNASRCWDLSDHDLLTNCHSAYPRARSWTLQPLPTATNSALTGALCKKCPLAGFLADAAPLPTHAGACGRFSARACSWTPGTLAPGTPSPSSNCLHSDIAPEQSLPATTLSALGQWRTPYERWVRRMPSWGPRTLV